MLTEGLGSEYKILGCKFKPYACCHELCPPIRMAQQLQEDHGIKPQDVEKIRIGLNHITAENQLKEAETPLHAQAPLVDRAIGIATHADGFIAPNSQVETAANPAVGTGSFNLA